jgi:hypothetical protein
MDLTVQCGSNELGSNTGAYGTIFTFFWILLSIWVIFVPMAFFALLKYISPSLESGSITFLADACRFLWHDYNTSIWFWDIIDTMRKIFLTGIIIFIDKENGSNTMLRLAVAIVVSVLYMGILLDFRPYKRQDDYYLALASNFLLICCFVMGMILKLCSEEVGNNTDNEQDMCKYFIGTSFDSYKASLMVVSNTRYGNHIHTIHIHSRSS